MGMLERGGNIERIQEIRVVEPGSISRDKQGLSEWAQVLMLEKELRNSNG